MYNNRFGSIVTAATYRLTHFVLVKQGHTTSGLLPTLRDDSSSEEDDNELRVPPHKQSAVAREAYGHNYTELY